MAKLIFLIVAVVVLVLWFKAKGRKERELDAKPGAKVEDMVRCRVCGVNLPRSEALLSRERFYCCDEHRQRDKG